MKQDTTVELVETIFQASRLMKEEMSYSSDLVHLSIVQIQTLIYLDKNKEKPVTMSDIAGHFRIELPSATSLLNKLYALKLVERHSDESDRRLVLITLTKEGRTLLLQAMSQRKAKLEKILSYLSETEKIEFLHILKTLNSRFQA